MNRSVTQEGLIGPFSLSPVGLSGIQLPRCGFASVHSRKDVIFRDERRWVPADNKDCEGPPHMAFPDHAEEFRSGDLPPRDGAGAC